MWDIAFAKDSSLRGVPWVIRW